MKKYTKIGKLSSAITSLIRDYQFIGINEEGHVQYDKSIVLPIVELWGTVKLHGTNAAVRMDKEGNLTFQSRENEITPERDNAGFAFWASGNKDPLLELFTKIKSFIDTEFESIVIFGEWAGKGIQSNVAVSELPKTFYIFDICVIKTADLSEKESNYYIPMQASPVFKDDENGIYNLWDTTKFPVYNMAIDLENPKLVQNKLIDITDKVEVECPVGKFFNVEGIGEGVVWRDSTRQFICKIKGDKHAGKSKVRKTNIVDLEKLNSAQDFVERFADIERLEQGWGKLSELDIPRDIKHTGDFIRWVIRDILSEEMDTLVENGLEPKLVTPFISKKASRWFIDKLESEAFKEM